MHTANTLIVGFVIPALATSTALADFVGLVVALEHSSVQTIVGPRDVYHVYAQFTSPSDRVDSWFATGSNPFSIQNILIDGSTLGSGFLNLGGSTGNLPPTKDGDGRLYDTYASIGLRYGDEAIIFGGDQAAVSLGFPVFIAGNSVFSSDGAVFIPTSAPQGRADFRVTSNDTNLRVLLMQLTVQVGQHVRGTLNVSGQIGTPSGMQPFTALGQTFISVPVPGGLAFVACAIAVHRRKRLRTCL